MTGRRKYTKADEEALRREVVASQMPGKFNVLATYNAEVARGIMHTPEWDTKMADLQREYWLWMERRA